MLLLYLTYLIHVTVPVILSTIMFTVILLTCTIHVHVIVSAIMLLVDFATLLDTDYTSYGDILLMLMYTLPHKHSVMHCLYDT